MLSQLKKKKLAYRLISIEVRPVVTTLPTHYVDTVVRAVVAFTQSGGDCQLHRHVPLLQVVGDQNLMQNKVNKLITLTKA